MGTAFPRRPRGTCSRFAVRVGERDDRHSLGIGRAMDPARTVPQCPGCGGDIRLIAFITDPRLIRKILTHLGEPLEPPPVSPARGPPTDWGELVQVHNECDVTQTSPDELPAIDIHSL